jgi:hypothetical protein
VTAVAEPRPATSVGVARATTALDPFAALRAREYGRLDEQGEAYLDYTGAGLYADSQVREHLALLRHGVLGNPHSQHPASTASTELADRARAAILAFVNASRDEYAVVFTANASGALKLVGEAFPFAERSRLVLTADNHNSVNGIRKFAGAHGADVQSSPSGRTTSDTNRRRPSPPSKEPRPVSRTCLRSRPSRTTRASATRSSGSRPPMIAAMRCCSTPRPSSRRTASTWRWSSPTS